MNSFLRLRRPGHQHDDIHRWRYQRHDGVSAPPSFSPCSYSGSDIDWDDYSSRLRDDYSSGALSGLFEGYH